MKKYNEIQLTKNKMDLNIRKMTNHPPSPEYGKKKSGHEIKKKSERLIHSSGLPSPMGSLRPEAINYYYC